MCQRNSSKGCFAFTVQRLFESAVTTPTAQSLLRLLEIAAAALAGGVVEPEKWGHHSLFRGMKLIHNE
jgi:hypothetical protein